jgi:hypothetical protein
LNEFQTIVIVLHIAVATALHRGQSSAATAALLECSGKMGLQLRPMHPNANDPFLMPFFVVYVTQEADVSEILNKLRDCPGIEAAYTKPPDETP